MYFPQPQEESSVYSTDFRESKTPQDLRTTVLKIFQRCFLLGGRGPWLPSTTGPAKSNALSSVYGAVGQPSCLIHATECKQERREAERTHRSGGRGKVST